MKPFNEQRVDLAHAVQDFEHVCYDCQHEPHPNQGPKLLKAYTDLQQRIAQMLCASEEQLKILQDTILGMKVGAK